VVSNVVGSVRGAPVRPSTPNSWIPPPPPVNVSNFLITAGVATAIAKVASARYRPVSRNAGKPKRKPTNPATRPASGIVQRSFMSFENTCEPSLSAGSESEMRIAVV
jgi:hypothetical protein